METKSKINNVANLLVIIALALLIPVALVGILTAFANSRKIEAIPEDLPMEEKYRLINIINDNQSRIDSLCLVIDTLKHNERINELRLRKALKPRNIIINDTLKIEQ